MDIQQITTKFHHRIPGTVGKHRVFSILIPFVEKEGELFLLFEIRSSKLKRQPGDICFPGGAIEKGETPLQGAVRETMEELGVKREDIHVISKADTLHTTANFMAHCYIGELSADDMKINEEEVESTFLVPLDFFLENEPELHLMKMFPRLEEDFPYDKIAFGKGYKWRTGQADVPIYDFEGKIIWGITARIVHNLVKILKGEKQ